MSIDRNADGSDRARPSAERPPGSRLLSVGAKGAERIAHATGVDRTVNQAVEEALVRALESPAVIRAIERALETHAATAELNSDEIGLLVRRVLHSEAAEHAWAEVLASEQAQMLVERIAEAPEIRAAIRAQSAGLITDIGVRLTEITEGLDDALERWVRPRDAESETNQAGLATRLVAAAVDLALLWAGYSLFSSLLAWTIPSVFGQNRSTLTFIALCVVGFVAGFWIFAGFWSLAGQTPGMRFLSIRLVYNGSHTIPLKVALRRALALILAVLPLGLGVFAILRDRSRRGWHDRMTGTEVIYDTAARAAPYAIRDHP